MYASGSTFGLGPLLYVVIILVLTGVSIWDVVVIIDDYKSENRMTLVKTEKADNGRIAFLENTTVQICLYYDTDTIFQELWLKNSTRPDDKTVREEIKAFAFAHPEKLQYPYNFSLAQKLAVAKLFDDRYWTDYTAVNCIHKGLMCYPELSYLDEFYNILRNFSLDALEESLWHSVRPDIVAPFDSDFSPSSVIIQKITEQEVCFEILLSKLLRSDNKSVSFLFGMVDNGTDKLVNSYSLSKPLVFTIAAGTYNSDSMEIPLKKLTQATLTVSNVGVFDKTQTTPCSTADRGTLQFVYLSDECFPVQVSEILKDVCGCVPFSFRKYLPTLSASGLPYCTAATYENCTLKANKRWANRSECSPSCVTKRNQYVLTSEIKDQESFMCSDASSNGWWNNFGCSRLKLTIMVPDLTYLVYEERFQLTPTQLWSQVGGDVGLYTGLSILSFWKLAVFTYMFYQNRKKKKLERISPIRGPRKGFSAVATDYLKELADVYDPRDVDGVKADVDALKKSLADNTARLSRIEKMLDILIRKSNVTDDDIHL